jgi:hypothetical protein
MVYIEEGKSREKELHRQLGEAIKERQLFKTEIAELEILV